MAHRAGSNVPIRTDSMDRVVAETRSAEETSALGEHLAAAVEPGDVLLLVGTFGAGKTTLTQGLARGLGVVDDVTSPSFVIANEYEGHIALYHLDLYRLEQMDRFTLEALDEYFGGDGVCVVEWPDTVPVDRMQGATRIELSMTGATDRRITLGPGPSRLLDAARTWAPPSPRRAPPSRAPSTGSGQALPLKGRDQS